MEKITELGLVNGQSVQIVHHEGEVYVPIKPICEILGVNYTTQMEKIQNHPIFGSSTIPLRGTVAADNKEREMIVMNLRFVFGWLFSINANNVKEEIRENLIKYQLECNRILFNAFFNTPKKMNAILSKKASYVKQICELDKMEKELKHKKGEFKKKLEELDKALTNSNGMLELDFTEMEENENA